MFAKWLIKRLEKQEETREEGRERLIFISGLIGILANILLFGVKFGVGWLAGSIAVMADALDRKSVV